MNKLLWRPVKTCWLGGVGGISGTVSPGELLAEFDRWCETHVGAKVDLLLPNDTLQELVCDPKLPLANDDEVMSYGRQQFVHYFGNEAIAWPLAVWSSGSLRGVSALVGGVDLASLEGVARKHRVTLRRICPAWAKAVANDAAQQRKATHESAMPDYRFAWVEGLVAMLASFDDGQLAGVRRLRLSAISASALMEALGQEGGGEAPLRIAGSATADWITGGVSSALNAAAVTDATDEGAAANRRNSSKPFAALPDFLAHRVRRSPLATPLAALGVLVLCLSAADAWNQYQDWQSAVEAREAVEGRVLMQRNASRMNAEPARPLTREHVRALTEMRAALTHRWEAVLSGVERAGGDVSSSTAQWLSLNYLSAKGDMRLEGSAADKVGALLAVERLASTPGWQDVTLRRLQAGEQGQALQRFEISAKLVPEELFEPKLRSESNGSAASVEAPASAVSSAAVSAAASAGARAAVATQKVAQ